MPVNRRTSEKLSKRGLQSQEISYTRHSFDSTVKLPFEHVPERLLISSPYGSKSNNTSKRNNEIEVSIVRKISQKSLELKKTPDNGQTINKQETEERRTPLKFNLKRKLCAFVFGLKFIVALLVALTAMLYIIYNIYDKHIHAPVWQPPPVIPVFEPDSLSGPQCAWDSTRLSRVEPPDGTFLFGFHLE